MVGEPFFVVFYCNKYFIFWNFLERERRNLLFPSNKCPLTVDELSPFELDLLIMIKNVEFRKITDVFQSMLREEITKNVFILADKSANNYAMKKYDYN